MVRWVHSLYLLPPPPPVVAYFFSTKGTAFFHKRNCFEQSLFRKYKCKSSYFFDEITRYTIQNAKMLHLMLQIHHPKLWRHQEGHPSKDIRQPKHQIHQYWFTLIWREFTHFSGVQFKGQIMLWRTKNSNMRYGCVWQLLHFHPRIALLRFAMEKFSLEPEDLENTFIHLTNFAQVRPHHDNCVHEPLKNLHLSNRNTQTKRGESKTCYPDGCQVRNGLNSTTWECVHSVWEKNLNSHEIFRTCI